MHAVDFMMVRNLISDFILQTLHNDKVIKYSLKIEAYFFSPLNMHNVLASFMFCWGI